MKYKYDVLNKNQFESHQIALSLIKNNSKILDIGCATGYFAKELLKKGCITYGVDCDVNAIKKAEKYCQEVAVADVDENDIIPFKKHFFDYVVLMDVLEHLKNPEDVLSTIKPYLKKDGKIIVSVPNVAHASIRWMLFKGEFRYTNTGIMDKTHLHFFTQKSLASLIRKTGYRILEFLPTNGMCKVPLLYKITDRLPVVWQYKIACSNPKLFAYQFVVLAEAH